MFPLNREIYMFYMKKDVTSAGKSRESDISEIFAGYSVIILIC